MLMEHFLCDDVGGKRNVCGMERISTYNNLDQSMLIK
jgi:hypothetical protein